MFAEKDTGVPHPFAFFAKGWDLREASVEFV